MGADQPNTSSLLHTSSYFTTSIWLSCHPATIQDWPLWGLITLQGIFFSTIHFRFKYFMGACSSAINYNYKSIILAQLNRIKLWGLNLSSLFYQEQLLYNTTQSLSTLQNNIISIGAHHYLLFFDSRYYFPKMLMIIWSPFDVKDGG
jgi:hypothetical protein